MEVLSLLAEPFLDVSSRTFWPCLLVSALLALALSGSTRWDSVRAALRHRSTRLDVQLLIGRQLLAAVGALPALIGATALGIAVARWLSHLLGAGPLQGTLPAWGIAAIYAVTFLVAWDASRFVLHWMMHRVPVLWAFHQVHHSAEVLTPLTIHRVHPVETVLYAARGAGVTGVVAGVFFWLFGTSTPAAALVAITGAGVALNAVFGNLRHSHVWLRFGRWERWFVSPAQHQLHHADDPATYNTNYGVWLAVWDRLLGTWRPAPEAPPATYGIGAARNHGESLISAWWGPIRDAAGRTWQRIRLVADPVRLGQETAQRLMGPKTDSTT